jgi:putative inorganic carbon (HCO3(-)) transporter
MIDWPGLGVAALWIGGLALGLYALGQASWQGRSQRKRLRAVWSPRHSLLLDIGLLGVVLAILLTARVWWETALSGACGLAFAVQIGLDIRKVRGMRDNPAELPPTEPATSPPRGALQRAAWWVQQVELPVTIILLIPLVLLTRYAPHALGVAILLWIVRWAALGHPTRPTPVDGAILLLLFQVGLSLSATPVFHLTWIALNQLLAGILLFYAVVNWAECQTKHNMAFLILLLLGAALAAVPLVARIAWPEGKFLPIPDQVLKLKPILSESVNANVLAGNLVLVFPLALAGVAAKPWQSLRKSARILAQILACLVAALMLATLVLTQSRGALVALVAGLALFGLLRFRWTRYVLPALIVLACIGLVLAGPAEFYNRVVTPNVTDIAERRLEIWSRAIYAVQDFSFTGIGIGNFGKVIPILYPYFLHGPDAQVGHAHNLFLQVAADLGLPGLIAYLAFLMGGIAAAWRLYRLRSEGWSTLGAAFLATYGILLVHGLVDAVTWGTKPAFVQWMIAGLVFATARVATHLLSEVSPAGV